MKIMLPPLPRVWYAFRAKLAGSGLLTKMADAAGGLAAAHETVVHEGKRAPDAATEQAQHPLFSPGTVVSRSTA